MIRKSNIPYPHLSLVAIANHHPAGEILLLRMGSSIHLRHPLHISFISSSPSPVIRRCRTLGFRFRPISAALDRSRRGNISEPNYLPGPVDDLLLNFFRQKMVEEVGWDSQKPGYDGLMEVVNHLMIKGSKQDVEKSAVQVLRSLFPPFLLELYQLLITPIAGGKPAALMLARATALLCQWLMGKCTVNSVALPDGSSASTGVFIERCKYLEESKCVGVCVHTCKLPTQAFFKKYMGVPLLMEPNFQDYSCQFSYGVEPPEPAKDKVFLEPCLDICPNATRRRELCARVSPTQCPKV